MYAQVIVDITHEKLDKVFDYRIPSHLEGVLSIGAQVQIPFGKGNREIQGYVVGMREKTTYDPAKIKEILREVPSGVDIESRLVTLAAWMKDTYGGTMIQALRTVLPIKKAGAAKVKETLRLRISEEEGKKKLEEYLQKNQRARARLLAALLDEQELPREVATKQLHITTPVVRALEEQGVLELLADRVYRSPLTQAQIQGEAKDAELVMNSNAAEEKKFVLSDKQQTAVKIFVDHEEKEEHETYLLYGVTGSGKTEVYMEMIKKVVTDGKQAIVLIPEIALTYQTVMRFYKVFGRRISILNSRMTPNERYDQLLLAKEGKIDVMIGPRSALFTPFPHLGLIVIDEEHESTYKSEQVPRYHARETAEKRAKLEGASVVLGSATPSLEAYSRALSERYLMLSLPQRVEDRPLAEVQVVDMREELQGGNRSILSRTLKEQIQDRLQKKEQIMLFLNRRGYAGFVACRNCGYVVKCPHCDVSLSSHRNGKLVCHYCGYEMPTFKNCPECGSPYIGGFRAGTQQIEELIKKEFPMAKVLRMDRDTTGGKEGHEKILSAFAGEEAQILIGTQMIVKGHDFPKVTLVGVLAADMSLYGDDYRCGERTFALLAQAAGRAGRGLRRGQVVIQTYSPEHYAIQAAAEQNYERFYQEEMEFRNQMGYPPARELLAVLMTGAQESQLDVAASYLKEFAKKIVPKSSGIQVIGPAIPAIGKVKDIYRRIIYVKGDQYAELVLEKNKMEQYIEINRGFQQIRVQFDFNPMQIF